jgi:hypothetical protein
MPTTTNPPKEKIYPAELRELLEQGNSGDPTAVPELKEMFAENPEMAAALGDLVRHAEEALLTRAGGDNYTAREAIAHQVAELRARLARTATSELEKLLVDRIAVSWIEAYFGDVDLAQHLLQQAGDAPSARAAQRRLDRAHARYLAAIKALATVRRLLRPAPSAVDLAMKAVSEGPAVRRCRTARPASTASGVPVLN